MRQTFLVHRIGEPGLILQGKNCITFKRYLLINPAKLDAVVK